MKMLFPILVEEHKNGELKFLYRISTASHEGTRTAVRLFANAYDSGDYSINGLALWAKRMDVELKNIPLLLKDITEEENQ